MPARTSRNHRLHPCAVNESSLDRLGSDIRPVDAMLHGIVVNRRHVVDVRHGEGDDVIVVRVVDVNAADLDLTSVQKELPRLWKKQKKKIVKENKGSCKQCSRSFDYMISFSVKVTCPDIVRVHLCRCVYPAAAS